MERLSPQDRKALQEEMDLRHRRMAKIMKFFWATVVMLCVCFGWVFATQNTRTAEIVDMSAFVVFIIIAGCGVLAFVSLIILLVVYTYNSCRISAIQHMLNRR